MTAEPAADTYPQFCCEVLAITAAATWNAAPAHRTPNISSFWALLF